MRNRGFYDGKAEGRFAKIRKKERDERTEDEGAGVTGKTGQGMPGAVKTKDVETDCLDPILAQSRSEPSVGLPFEMGMNDRLFPIEDHFSQPLPDMVLESCQSLKSLGLALAWSLLKGGFRDGLEKSFQMMWGEDHLDWFARRQRRQLYPYPDLWRDLRKRLAVSPRGFWAAHKGWSDSDIVDCWLFCTIVFTQQLWKHGMCFKGTRPNILQKECLKELTDRIGVILAHDCCINYGVAEIKRDLDGKDVSYTGEEVARMQKLSVRRMLPALPPQGHGGSISAVDWVSSSTRSLLENPEASLIEDDGRELPCLQGKVHIEKGEELAVAQTLVSRNVCVWIDDDDVMTFRQQKVYNGLFGVEKATTIESGETTLRCIMNLVPSNSRFKILEGGVRRLPHITQWLSVYIGEEEELEMHQSDITAAFYLFQLPSCWRRCLAFNIRVRGSELGPNYTPEKLYTLASNVYPWDGAARLA